ncbi:MAG: Lrp/AsnC ligand binding domain-containing protein [Candidatus Thermoplasmatota archaeon]|jgi:DNA-binding Lrp family transcriptional regulator|nr:Lrp/AsnC ligand binding domain-containing protein [Candidatus Thermoplasmatota archaeon]
MATGYVLVNVEPGMEFSVFETVKELDKVADATLLFGDYDIIIKVIAEDMSAIAAFVVENVRQVEGVLNTKTLAGAEI